MSLTLVDYLLTFDELRRQRHYPAGVQAAFLTIIMEFNRERYPKELRLTVRELVKAAGLNSTATAQEYRRRLKNDGLIDFRKDRDGTSVYTLPTERYENNQRTRAERRANMERTRLGAKYSSSSTQKRDVEEEERFARYAEVIEDD